MWAQEQFFDSVQIFSLWSKYILSCSIMAENIALSYPYDPPTQEIGSFHVGNIFLEFS